MSKQKRKHEEGNETSSRSRIARKPFYFEGGKISIEEMIRAVRAVKKRQEESENVDQDKA